MSEENIVHSYIKEQMEENWVQHSDHITKLLCGDFIHHVFCGSPSPLCFLMTTEQWNRLCCACYHQPGAPQHILFQFPLLPSITSLRSTFITTMQEFRPLPANSAFSDMTALHYLKAFIFNWSPIAPTTKFVHDVVDQWQNYLETGSDQHRDGSAVSDNEDSDKG
ncbi:hypothetical protein C8J55DRAFT_555651 [Lentinula edodes]|uniref:Uncharacterized protein n=1 Tax=Lentinula lateritia TaxID=40482 RepID=A0A9W9AY79_9AGAR|nr:hypothetical protein C8J55DRAFT_555651 [Lentinula edodes]